MIIDSKVGLGIYESFKGLCIMAGLKYINIVLVETRGSLYKSYYKPLRIYIFEL